MGNGASQEAIARIADEFAIEGEFVSGNEIESGHINSTYRVKFRTAVGEERSYLLQRINELVFRDPHAVMDNVERVTRHINWKVLRVKKDLGGQTLNLYPGRGGKFGIEGPGGGLWRCYNFIEGCRTYDIVENTRQAFQAARAFGSFQDLVSDLPVDSITETIPHFHDTPRRYRQFMEAVDADPLGRVAGVASEIAFIRDRETELGTISDGLASGEIPRRIAHNDTKLNNVMIDEASDEAVCVIDLDTVMPGSVLHDFGDLVRTATSPAAEDERDLSKIVLRMPFFEALVDGYLQGAGDFLVAAEIELLAFSAKLITLELATRFLADHLQGDTYFKIHREGQNLDRCRAQLKLVEEMERSMPEMQRTVREAATR